MRWKASSFWPGHARAHGVGRARVGEERVPALAPALRRRGDLVRGYVVAGRVAGGAATGLGSAFSLRRTSAPAGAAAVAAAAAIRQRMDSRRLAAIVVLLNEP
jgi:hypothetical protein